MVQGQMQYDVTFFELRAGQHDHIASDLGSKLQEAGDGDWRISWVGITTEGVIMILQRSTPVTAPTGSLAGYGQVKG